MKRRHFILKDAQHGFRKRKGDHVRQNSTHYTGSSQYDRCNGPNRCHSSGLFQWPLKITFGDQLLRDTKHPINRWISSFLEDRNKHVHRDVSSSSPAPIDSGVSQGSVLGPLLFLLYINCVPKCISSESVARHFVDDCVFSCTGVPTPWMMLASCRKTLMASRNG